MKMSQDLSIILSNLRKLGLVFITVLLTSCSGQEAGNYRESDKEKMDSMPILDPVVPESANVMRPETKDTMPVVDPQELREGQL